MLKALLFFVALMFTGCHRTEDKYIERWEWLIERDIISDVGQSDSYKRGFTYGIRVSLDYAMMAKDIGWSPLLVDDKDEQIGYYDGLMHFEKVIQVESAKTLDHANSEIHYLGMGKIGIYSN